MSTFREQLDRRYAFGVASLFGDGQSGSKLNRKETYPGVYTPLRQIRIRWGSSIRGIELDIGIRRYVQI
jgi:hypothetical protein